MTLSKKVYNYDKECLYVQDCGLYTKELLYVMSDQMLSNAVTISARHGTQMSVIRLVKMDSKMAKIGSSDKIVWRSGHQTQNTIIRLIVMADKYMMWVQHIYSMCPSPFDFKITEHSTILAYCRTKIRLRIAALGPVILQSKNLKLSKSAMTKFDYTMLKSDCSMSNSAVLRG